jgi:predicted transcriptional regulator YheO
MTQELERTGADPFKKIEEIEEIGLYHIKGYRNSEIAEITNKSPATVREYIKLYKEQLSQEVERDPYFLERIQHNVLRVMAEFDEISKEAWETVSVATEEGMLAQRTAALKLALDVSKTKAQVLQLMGGANSDNEYISRMQKAETVNMIISRVISEVVADCPKCSIEAKPRLREAFALMDDSAIPDDAEYVDAEIVDA